MSKQGKTTRRTGKKTYGAPKRNLLRRKDAEEAVLPKKTKKRSKKKTRVRHMFKKGQPHGSRPY